MADDPATGILYPTHCTLCKHDYANPTFQDTATEVNTSTASIHYDSSDQLFGVFLDEGCEVSSTLKSAS